MWKQVILMESFYKKNIERKTKLEKSKDEKMNSTNKNFFDKK